MSSVIYYPDGKSTDDIMLDLIATYDKLDEIQSIVFKVYKKGYIHPSELKRRLVEAGYEARMVETVFDKNKTFLEAEEKRHNVYSRQYQTSAEDKERQRNASGIAIAVVLVVVFFIVIICNL